MKLRDQVARAIDAAFDANEPLDQWELALLEADAAMGVLEQHVKDAYHAGYGAATIRFEERLAAIRAELDTLPEGLRKGDVRRDDVVAGLARLGGDMGGVA